MALPTLFRIDVTSRIFGLDVLRAFAILMVMLLHSSTWISPQFTLFHEAVRRYDGVGVFFVLSGFLIGGILIKTLETKGPHLRNLQEFWLRRWIRTVPPYFLVLLLIMPIELRHGSFPASTYLSYFVFLQNLNWPMPPAFLESWSLTVEEWFYLLSAPSSFLLAKALKPRYGVLLAAGLFLILSTSYRFYLFHHYHPTGVVDWNMHFRGIVMLRLDSLMYGVVAAWVAYYYPEAWKRKKNILFVLGFFGLGLIASPNSPDDLGLFNSVFSFSCTSLGVACLLPLLSEWKRASGYVAYAVTHISLISYSLYLLHGTIINVNIALPVAQMLPLPGPIKSLTGMAILWGLSLPAATLMYKYFELPVMRLRNRI